MHTVYGGLMWNPEMRLMLDPIPTEEARRRFYGAGPPFAAAVGHGLATSMQVAEQARSLGRPLPVPEYTIEVAGGVQSVRTRWFNDYGSVVATYDFDRVDDERLFLAGVLLYEYEDEHRFFAQNDALVVHSFRFTPEGSSKQVSMPKDSADVEIVERSEVPVEHHWERVPKFGHWGSLGRLHRTPVLA